MSQAADIEQTFAGGRYSKRKRTQVKYSMDELDVTDAESDFESVQTKVLCITTFSTHSQLTLSRSANPLHPSPSPRPRSFPSLNSLRR